MQAAALVCHADVTDAVVGAQTLLFAPGNICAGNYEFASGTASSCTLVLQTLLFADQPSTVTVRGGTHNPMAPPSHFLQRAYGRVLAAMGATIDFRRNRFGFYPAGGGELVAQVQPCQALQHLDLLQRGPRRDGYAESFVAGVPAGVARHELACIGSGLVWEEAQLRACVLPAKYAPGNALLVTLEHDYVTEVFSGFGEKALRAETVSKQTLERVRRYIASGAAVSEWLADQIMLPMALAGGGSFTTDRLSLHAHTNAEVIARFLPVRFEFDGNDKISTVRIMPPTR